MTNAMITALKVFTLALVASITCMGSMASAQNDQSFLDWHEQKAREAQRTIEAIQRDQARYIGNPQTRYNSNYAQAVNGYSTRLAAAYKDLGEHMGKAAEYRAKISGLGGGRLRALAPVALAAGVAGAGTLASSETMASDIRVSSEDGAPKAVRLSGTNVGDRSDLLEEAAAAPARAQSRSASTSR
jgi:hypothetical protein